MYICIGNARACVLMNTATGAVMGCPSMRARVLVRKLCFLQKLVLGDGSNLGSRMLRSLADDVESVTLMRKCRELEEAFGTRYRSHEGRRRRGSSSS